ncbi:uncharacterized protein [Watersipora subatra]|uniref:uncharacterized protein n=1 Tax=Watersipora subatra TaxID=2589382 RepID=UPI00355BA11E
MPHRHFYLSGALGCPSLDYQSLQHCPFFLNLLTYLISWTLGDQMTDTYAYNTEDRKGSMTYLRDTFIPIGQSFQQEISGVHQQISLQFGNLTATIPDPSVFDIPSFCSKRN